MPTECTCRRYAMQECQIERSFELTSTGILFTRLEKRVTFWLPRPAPWPCFSTTVGTIGLTLTNPRDDGGAPHVQSITVSKVRARVLNLNLLQRFRYCRRIVSVRNKIQIKICKLSVDEVLRRHSPLFVQKQLVHPRHARLGYMLQITRRKRRIRLFFLCLTV